MYMDPPMATLSKNDGILSLMHCQERIFLCEAMGYTSNRFFHGRDLIHGVQTSDRSNVGTILKHSPNWTISVGPL